MPTLADVMIVDLKTISSGSSVSEAAKRMKIEGIGSLLVERKGRLLRDQSPRIVGLVTETDIIRKVVAEDKSAHETQVDAIITSPMITVEATWPINEAYDMMKAQGVRYLLVTESDRVVGLISLRDLLVFLKEA